MELTVGEALTLGAKRAHVGDHANAIGMFRGVLQHEPDNIEAMIRLGSSLFETQRLHEAFYWFWWARERDPKNPMALMNYGLVLAQLGHAEEAIHDIERAVRIGDRQGADPDIRALQYNNLGNTLERLGRYKEALEALDKGIAADPLDDFPHYNRGVVLIRLGRHREAIAALQRSLDLKGRHSDTSVSRLNVADARYNLSMANLLLGNLKEGFADYEARLETSETQLLPNFGLPLDRKWQPGQPIEGARLLIHGEQGLGDALQMLRFLPWLREQGPKEILFVEHAAIRTLLKHEPGVTVLEPGESIVDRFDLWCGLMSLPIYYGIIEREEHIPPPYPIPVELLRIERWKHLMPDRPRVGICWAGNFRHKNDHHRSISLEKFAEILPAAVNFVSLQQVRDEEKPLLHELMRRYPEKLMACDFDDFRDTAAVMRCLDLVVTVDTSVAHLAGCVGVPTWVLIPKFGTDWRWQLERSDSPWYPGMRLFRQQKVGDWATVLKAVKAELATLNHSAAARAA
jgi:tetratricopeptide (TPR) repeat protein